MKRKVISSNILFTKSRCKKSISLEQLKKHVFAENINYKVQRTVTNRIQYKIRVYNQVDERKPDAILPLVSHTFQHLETIAKRIFSSWMEELHPHAAVLIYVLCVFSSFTYNYVSKLSEKYSVSLELLYCINWTLLRLYIAGINSFHMLYTH